MGKRSKQYKDLVDNLYKQGKKLEDIKITVDENDGENAELTYTDGTIQNIQDNDAISFISKFHRGIDNDGDFVFRKIKDAEKYFEDEKFLCFEHDNKVKHALRELTEGKFKFSYDFDELQKDFLLSRKRSLKRFEPLKKHYFYIAAQRLNEAASLSNLHKKNINASKKYEDYFLAICKILSKAFRNDDNFIKNFASQEKRTKLDIVRAMSKYVSTLEYSKDVAPLFEPRGLPTNTAINLILNSYRKNAEACVELLNFVRVAHEFNSGQDAPELTKKAQDNKKILLPILAPYLSCFDPHLRNSESHLGTVLNHRHQTLTIQDQGNHVRRYTYREIINMTNDLSSNLLPALLTAVAMEGQVILLVLAHRSTEYVTALQGIDNS